MIAIEDVAALAWYRRAADAGGLRAPVHVGVMLAAGRGTARDDAAAVQWFASAAEAGSAEAMAHLGRRTSAARASGGGVRALTLLGAAYPEGRGTPRNKATARTFLNWRVQTRRSAGNSPAGVAKVTGEKKRKRRALTDVQVGKLLAAASAVGA